MMSLRQSTSFFASTCLLAMGGLLALIGNVEPLQGVATRLTNMESVSAVLQVKLFLPLFMLGNAFLKFVWSNRVFGYCSVIMGAEVPNDPDHPQTLPMALKAGHLNARRGFEFQCRVALYVFRALCARLACGAHGFCWWVLAVTAWVVWSREFASALSRDHLVAGTAMQREWWVMRDSNSRHLRCKRSALPTELITRQSAR